MSDYEINKLVESTKALVGTEEFNDIIRSIEVSYGKQTKEIFVEKIDELLFQD